MSRYIQSWIFATEFDGDAVKLTLRPLEQVDLMVLEPHLKELKAAGPTAQLKDVAKAFRDVIAKYVSKCDGLVDAAGAAIDFPTVARDAYFMGLLVKTGLELLSKASPANPVNPVESPAPGSPGLPLETTSAGAA